MVFGAGRCGRQVLHCISEAGYEVVAYKANDFLACSRDMHEREAFPRSPTRKTRNVTKPVEALELASNLDWKPEKNVAHGYRQIDLPIKLEVEELRQQLKSFDQGASHFLELLVAKVSGYI